MSQRHSIFHALCDLFNEGYAFVETGDNAEVLAAAAIVFPDMVISDCPVSDTGNANNRGTHYLQVENIY